MRRRERPQGIEVWVRLRFFPRRTYAIVITASIYDCGSALVVPELEPAFELVRRRIGDVQRVDHLWQR